MTTPTLTAISAPHIETAYEPAPAGTPADTPRVFAAIADVMRDAMPVGKNQRNQQQNYNFRGIDDVMSAMAGPMRRHGLFILPSIVDHKQDRDGKLTRTLITMRYRIYGPAGDCLIAHVPGEAFDFADKATNKAQSAALKYLLFTLFMLPVDARSIDDGDRHHPEPPAEHRAEMQQRQQRRPQAQQPRRSRRAEPGPWEQAAPPQGERRDYLAEAQAATDAATVRALWQDAKAAGAPADYLDQLAEIGRQLAADAEQEEAVLPDVDQARAAAESALRVAASRANLPDLDNAFQRVYGVTIEQAPAHQLDEFRQQIEQAAAGGAQ